MGTFLSILAIIWSILCIVLFFKIWGMTNDIKDIKDYIVNTRKKRLNENKFNIGDVVLSDSYEGILEIVDIYEDGTYNCKDTTSDDIIGVFNEEDLELK